MNAALFTPSISWPSVRGGVYTRVSLTALLLVACSKGTSAPLGSSPIEAPAPSPPPQPAATTSATVPEALDSTIVLDEPVMDSTIEPSGPCFDSEALAAAFDGQAVGSPAPYLTGRALYSWTTVEQAEELQAGGPLLSRTERPGAGPGHAIEYLGSQFYPLNADEQAIVDLLLSPAFARVRYAWPNAWATRMGWPATNEGPAESYGNQLLRITIKPDALWIAIASGRMSVFDSNGLDRSPAEALANPERVVGLYFHKEGGPRCGGTFGLHLSGSAYREFIVMNPDMVESWELGTSRIRDVVESDIEALTELFKVVRACAPSSETLEVWGARLVCDSWAGSAPFGMYESALALVNSLYLLRPTQLADLIATLQADLSAWEIRVSGPGEALDAGAASGSNAASVPSASEVGTSTVTGVASDTNVPSDLPAASSSGTNSSAAPLGSDAASEAATPSDTAATTTDDGVP